MSFYHESKLTKHDFIDHKSRQVSSCWRPTPPISTMNRSVRAQPADVAEAGGYRPYRIAIAEQQRLKIKKMLSKAIGILMVILFLLCILVGPDFNNANSDHRLFDLSPLALYIAYRVWVFSKLAYLVVANILQCTWFMVYHFHPLCSVGSLEQAQRISAESVSSFCLSSSKWLQCTDKCSSHRLLFITLIIAAIAAKLIVPNQIQLSYAPAALTILAEVTYLLIDLTCEVLGRLFLDWVPSLIGKLGKLVAVIWAMVVIWFGIRFDLHIGRG